MYFSDEFSKELNLKTSPLTNLLYSFIAGLLVLCFYELIGLPMGVDIMHGFSFTDLNFFLYFTGSKQDAETLEKWLANGGQYFLQLLLLKAGLAAALGYLTHKLVVLFGLDVRFKILRYRNEWHYIFTKKIFYYKQKNYAALWGGITDVEGAELDVLMEEGGQLNLYTGQLMDYELSPADIHKIERLHLVKAYRYKADAQGKRTAVSIPGELLTLMGDSIKNINVKYITRDAGTHPNASAKRLIKAAFINAYRLIAFYLLFCTAILFLLYPEALLKSQEGYIYKLITASFGLQLAILVWLNMFFGILLSPFTILALSARSLRNTAFIKLAAQILFFIGLSVLLAMRLLPFSH